jgi:hypothetical protein
MLDPDELDIGGFKFVLPFSIAPLFSPTDPMAPCTYRDSILK